MNLKKIKIQSGFTLIETLVFILIIATASSAFLLGITQAKLSLNSIKVKDKAHQELKEYTENIKSLVAGGVESFGSNPPNGIPIALTYDSNTGESIIEGHLHKTVVKCDNGACEGISDADDSGDYSIFYFIHTWITWSEKKKIFFQKTENSEDDLKKLEFKTYQVQLSL